jgi:hypothetical protein
LKLSTVAAAACCLTLAFVGCGSPGNYSFEDPDANGGDGPSPEGGADSRSGAPQAGGGAGGTGATAGSTSNEAGAGGDEGMGGANNGHSGEGGEGGTVDPPEPPAPGRPGQGVVSGGRLMSSANFTLWTSSGDSPSGNGVATSTNYRLVLGVVGTTQP